jgi:hypothetical protein
MFIKRCRHAQAAAFSIACTTFILVHRREKKWKRCPSCRHVVERSHGCNHMKCRCGCHFCYACGEKYISAKPSATNVHGTQGCSCDLFLVPEEPHQQQEAAAVVLAQVGWCQAANAQRHLRCLIYRTNPDKEPCSPRIVTLC